MIPEAIHGGIDPGEIASYGFRREQVIDFSANVNPFGPSPAVRDAVRNAALDQYPDRHCRELRKELARRRNVSEDEILVGNGSTELLWLLAVAHLRTTDRVVILGPTFGESEHAARQRGAEVTVCRATPETDFRPPVEAFADAIERHRPRFAVVTSPNNPTGRSVEPDCVASLARRYPATLFVLDEAYVDCLRVVPTDNPERSNNLLHLRSLTKAHALAGLRLGYVFGIESEITPLRRVQPPWSVNAPAQAAGIAALRDDEYQRQTLARWWRACDSLRQQLRAEGFHPLDSSVPFFLVPVANAPQARHRLLKHGLLVRDCTSFGLPRFIRISSRAEADNTRLVRALAACRQEIV
ncbi:pyridoxal phosphate-dependent aminotransferase [Limnoglobus roseus]|uniref:Aminotransferase n=1 Tax=Limnoglobus roseus TaxID=2598579 RepID=A0A5C1AMW2_9BACT|nr:histidinol-phosphate transaminase [Limnoglobus roseus]QEL18248.1 histidinol-phosphate transaminase [Limnoglobus roseus]